MSILQSIDIRARILCQDVRQEKSNKLIIIGVYPSDVVFAFFPANNLMAFYIEADVIKNAAGTLHMRVQVNDSTMVEMGIALELEVGKTLVIPSPQLTLRFDQPGTLSIDMSDDEKTWVPLLRRTTLEGPVDVFNPIETERPSGQSPNDAPASFSPPAPSRPSSPKKLRRS